MTKTLEELKEKNFGFWLRVILRSMALITIGFYMVFRICVPLVNSEKVVMDRTDGWVLLGAIALILSVEGVKYAVDQYIKRKTK